MIIDKIRKDNIQALKDKNTNARAVFSVLLNKYMLMEINLKTQNKQMTDAETVAILQKTIKELQEEAANYQKAGNAEQYAKINEQNKILTAYLPQMLSEQEIKNIISGLPDKSLPNIMKHFKANYDGKVDMGLVNKLAREI